MSILYPVADNAEAALHAPKGLAARERDAMTLAEARVAFVTEAVGPSFETRDAAMDAYAGRLDDVRPGKAFSLPPEARWCTLRPVAPDPALKRKKPVKPLMKNGRRWPTPDPAAAPARWRLSVSYWRIAGAEVAAAEAEALEAARKLRREASGEGLGAGALRALAQQPLRPLRPQQPLDIGLFETRLPEAPHIIMPDE
jgi:hypothetical protein